MILASNHELPLKTTLNDIQNKPLILYRRYYSFILDAFSQSNIEPNIFSICNDGRTSISLLKTTNTYAILPESMLPLCNDLYISTIDEENLETEILFAYNKNTHSQFVKELIQIIKESE